MSLDSSESYPNSLKISHLPYIQVSLEGKEEHPEPNWVFIFTHRQRIDKVNEVLKKKFETFVHKKIIYQRKAKGKIIKKEIPTVSGLIFIHGSVDDVRNYLQQTFPEIYPVKNYSTGKIAEISNKEMAIFMNISKIETSQIRFMLNPLDYYADGHQRIRITSGEFKDCEGYLIRIHRDRKLITQIGNMTVAISGVAKESFENAEDFIESRRNENIKEDNNNLRTPLEQEILRYFFTPSNDLEAMAVTKNILPLIPKFQRGIISENDVPTIEAIFFTLAEIAERFESKYFNNETIGINQVCVELIKILKKTIENPAVKEAVKEGILVKLESLMLCQPVLPIEEVINNA